MDGNPAAELAAWQQQHRRAWIARQSDAADVRAEEESRAAQDSAADAADGAAYAGFVAQMQGRPQMTVGAVLEQSRVAQDAPPRDASAPWGSELNPALLLDGRVIEPTPLARSAGDEQLLAKARALRGDLVRYRRQRRGGMRSITRAATIGRSESCVWCTQENLSDEQSYLLHSDPQWNVPVTPPGYFDADEEPAGRTSSGLGWPEIYR